METISKGRIAVKKFYWHLAVDVTLISFLKNKVNEHIHVSFWCKWCKELWCVPDHHSVGYLCSCVFRTLSLQEISLSINLEKRLPEALSNFLGYYWLQLLPWSLVQLLHPASYFSAFAKENILHHILPELKMILQHEHFLQYWTPTSWK